MVIAEQESTHQMHRAGGQVPNSTREELARIQAGETEGLSAREEIVDSWRESVSLGLLPRHFDLPCDSSLDPDSDLIRAAMPVVDRLGSDLATTAMSVVLDRKSVV